MLQKIRFFAGIGSLYIATVGTIGGILYSSQFSVPVQAKPIQAMQHKPIKLPPKIIAGKPIRITITSASIDLPINEGTYNPSDGTWTLSDTHAQFATMTAPANDHAGTTFVYGHGTDAVFGKIGSRPPAIGTIATVQTDNGKTFTYILQTVRDFTPDDVSLLNDTASGPPRLVVQTCTGVFSEWRTMFIFDFKEVI